MKIRLGLLLLAALGTAAAGQANQDVTAAQQAPAAKPNISVTIKAAHDVVKAGTEVRVIVTTTNISDHPLQFLYVPRRYIPDDFSIGIEVWDAKDTPISPRKRQAPNAMMSILGQSPLSSETLQPGESQHYDDYEFVSKIFDTSKPGKYTIQVTRGDPSTGIQVKSNKVTVEVTR
ncbi:MAG: hypothetical protein ABSD20_10450 [Terriglobales bacterium]|jgi:hypothetical protein